MYVFISVLIVVASLFLILAVVVQNSKGGGLAAGFSSSNQVMGVRKTTDFLEKATWGLGGFIAVLCILGSFFLPTNAIPGSESELKNTIQNIHTVDPNTVSPFGSAAPEATPAE
ncbi:preprotein translocase subunit SecG [Bacteroidales bacterium]|nr:preprotein translocase subunit SecG [Bacteroidales bacterium]